MLRENFDRDKLATDSSISKSTTEYDSLRNVLRELSLTRSSERLDSPRDLPSLELLNDNLLVSCENRGGGKDTRSVDLDGTITTRRGGVLITERSDGSTVTTRNDRLISVVYPDGKKREFEYSDKSSSPSKITVTFAGKTDQIVWTRGEGNVWKSDTGQEFVTSDKTNASGDYIFKDPKGAKTVLKADGTRLEWSAKGQLTEVRYADGREAKFEWDQTSDKLNRVSLRDGTRLQREGDEWKVLVAAPGMPTGVHKFKISFASNGDVTLRDERNSDHIFRVNGDRQIRYAHGASDIEKANGARIIEKDSDTRARLIRQAGGNLVELDDRGKPASVRTADGIWRQREGVWFFKKPGVAEREGQFRGSITADAAGNCRIEGEDKTRTTYRLDGTRLREYASGAIESELKQRDGCTLIKLKNGRQEQVLPDGSKIEINEAGRTSAVVDSKGKKWEVLFDGSGRLKTIKSEDQTWNRAPGHKRWRNENGDKSDTVSLMPIEQLAAVFIHRPEELLKFRRDAQALDSRLKSNPVTKENHAEIRKSVAEQVARLLVAGDREKSRNEDGERVRARVGQEDRVMLAKQIMHHAAHPYRTDQGYHGTCSVSTVETRLYTRQPNFVAKLIADVALTGSYKAGDGTLYQFPANDPTLRRDGDGAKRSLASQLFVATAVNVFWANQDKDPSGKEIEKGSLRYEQRRINRGKKDGGECLVDTKTGKVIEDWSAINISRVAEMSRRLTGNDERMAIAHRTRGEFAGVVPFTTKESLRDNLIRMKKEKILPASTSVNTGNKFFGDSPASATMHAVSIVDFDEKTNTVMVDNQWGDENDHLGLPGTGRRLTLDEFYEATIWKEKEKEKEKPPVKDR